MTRKQALHTAILQLSKYKKYAEEVRVLQEISDELPLVHWSDSSIRDAVEQFILDNGRAPTATDFKKRGMPPHTVVRQKYGVTLGEWLAANYPTVKPDAHELRELYTAGFVDDYMRIKPRSEDEFNKKKSSETRGWKTVAQYHGLKSWRALLKALGLPLYFDLKRDRAARSFRVNVVNDYDFRD